MNGSLFWNASIEDLKRGFLFNKQEDIYACLFCGTTFERGVIYPMDDLYLDAEKAINTHIKTHHPSTFDFYLGMGRIYTGLSNGQSELAKLFYEGYSDKEIVSMTGANSASTIRNQRFSIREKYKQAKILVALTELLEERLEELKRERKTVSTSSALVDFHPAATMVDERYAITQEEKEEVLSRYFSADNKLLIKGIPAKEKKKIIILQKIMEDFKANTDYTEKEVNAVLKGYYDDFVSVRRHLIEYGFLDRNNDGTRYWVKLV